MKIIVTKIVSVLIFFLVQGLKIDGSWNEINDLCVTKNAKTSETSGFQLNNLKGDTYYRIQIRAHNAIGFSKPVILLMRTAIGESSNALGSLLYFGHSSATSFNLATQANIMLFMLFSFCVQFGFYVR